MRKRESGSGRFIRHAGFTSSASRNLCRRPIFRFPQVRPTLETNWLRARQRQALEDELDVLRRKYEIVMPEGWEESPMRRLLLSVVALMLFPLVGHAHKLGVARLLLEEIDADTYVVRYEVPLGEASTYPPPILPAHCRWEEPPSQPEGRVRLIFHAEDHPLSVDDVLILHWQRNGVLATAVWRSGAKARQFFPNTREGIEVRMDQLRAGSGTLGRTGKRYFVMGMEHILQGTDHLFFIGGLLLLVSGVRPLLLTITAFTIAHSLTLGLSVFGIFRLSAEMTDVLVAFSIVLLAGEIIRMQQGRSTLASRKPWLVSFCFGLVHGLGFAGALEALGLPNESIPLVLLFFNLGVEAGQLLFMGLWLAVLASLRTLDIARGGVWRWLPTYGFGNDSLSLADRTLGDTFYLLKRSLCFYYQRDSSRPCSVGRRLSPVPPALFAHSGQGEGFGFGNGFQHPLTGLDHVIAMLAVGLWGAQLGKPLLWGLPVCFPAMMAVGAALGNHRHTASDGGGADCVIRGGLGAICVARLAGSTLDGLTAGWALCALSRLCAWGGIARIGGRAVLCGGVCHRHGLAASVRYRDWPARRMETSRYLVGARQRRVDYDRWVLFSEPTYGVRVPCISIINTCG